MASTLETKAAALEGLDFIETEEDVKAVEAATLKIQSTFRGKKIRSKITAPKQPSSQTSAAATTTATTTTATASSSSDNQQKKHTPIEEATRSKNDNELSKKVAEMQVQDNNNNNNTNQMDEQHQKQRPTEANTTPSGLPEDEAERAATKIQAGFKGYKTRKELEGKLPATGPASGSGGSCGGAGSERQ